MKLFCVAGVQRGGQHLIIDYIIHMFPKVAFKNDCSLCPTNGSYPFKYYENGKLVKQLSKRYEDIKHMEFDAIILGAENMCIQNSNKCIEKLKYITPNIRIIHVIRNPLNVLASCIQFSNVHVKFKKDLNITTIIDVLIKMIENGNDGIYHLNYDKFITSIDIRKNLFAYCNPKKEFEQFKFNIGDLQNPHKDMENNIRYQKLLTPKMIELSKLFLDTPKKLIGKSKIEKLKEMLAKSNDTKIQPKSIIRTELVKSKILKYELKINAERKLH
jgi:hypothetical protein